MIFIVKMQVRNVVLILVAGWNLVESFVPSVHNEIMTAKAFTRTSPVILYSESDDEDSVGFEKDSDSSVEAIESPRAADVKCPDCDLCDGSGRIIGGLGAIELFSWWPIKAYRPCPNFIERGGQYVRSGQGLDEIAFGRDSSYTPDN